MSTSENDRHVPPPYGKDVADLTPGTRLRLFRGPLASHCSCLEMPKEFLALTHEFVDGIR